MACFWPFPPDPRAGFWNIEIRSSGFQLYKWLHDTSDCMIDVVDAQISHWTGRAKEETGGNTVFRLLIIDHLPFFLGKTSKNILCAFFLAGGQERLAAGHGAPGPRTGKESRGGAEGEGRALRVAQLPAAAALLRADGGEPGVLGVGGEMDGTGMR